METKEMSAAEDWVAKRYWDIESVGQEMIDMNRKCGVEDFQAGERHAEARIYREALKNSSLLFESIKIKTLEKIITGGKDGK